jgi:hypothetical protein
VIFKLASKQLKSDKNTNSAYNSNNLLQLKNKNIKMFQVTKCSVSGKIKCFPENGEVITDLDF